MSNIIVNKDRWQPKPKYNKAKSSSVKVQKKAIDLLLSQGYTYEEAEKILLKKSNEFNKEKNSKRKQDILNYINLQLVQLSQEQKESLLDTICKEFTNKKIAKIKQHIDKLKSKVKKIESTLSNETFQNATISKKYKKKEFNSVKDLRKGTFKIKKK